MNHRPVSSHLKKKPHQLSAVLTSLSLHPASVTETECALLTLGVLKKKKSPSCYIIADSVVWTEATLQRQIGLGRVKMLLARTSSARFPASRPEEGHSLPSAAGGAQKAGNNTAISTSLKAHTHTCTHEHTHTHTVNWLLLFKIKVCLIFRNVLS